MIFVCSRVYARPMINNTYLRYGSYHPLEVLRGSKLALSLE